MKPEVRVWWEELADQYEKWATNPPKQMDGREEYTCIDLNYGKWGFGFDCRVSACTYLFEIWEEEYGCDRFPAGRLYELGRNSRRFDFCWYMAERIREYLGEE